MKTKLATLFLSLFFTLSSYGQSYYSDAETEIVRPVKLDGPRVGMTYIAPGSLATSLREDYNIDPYITQFGWQFETRFFTLKNGTSGVIEFVPLIGGLEQEKFLPSLSCLIGLRNCKGLEFGFGPNISPTGSSFVLAVGHTFKTENINFPVNLAVVPSRDGVRLCLLMGFNARYRY